VPEYALYELRLGSRFEVVSGLSSVIVLFGAAYGGGSDMYA